MSKIGYFPGCSLGRSAREYDKSGRLVCRQLGIELEELPDWSCCGAHAASHTRHKLAIALGARNLNIAASNGFTDIVAPCPACYSGLKYAHHELQENVQLKEEFKAEFNFDCNSDTKIVSLLELLAGIEPAKLKEKVKVDLGELKLVAYYGCLLVRPPKLAQFDDPENPSAMDNLLASVGVQVLDWDYKVQCCGATIGIGDPGIQANLSGDILEMAMLAGADAIAVACPLCHSNLDLRQGQVNRRRKREFDIPIFYFTQLIGLAFGASPKEVGVDKHIVDTGPLLTRLEIK